MHHLILPAGYANSLGVKKKMAKVKNLPASARDTGDTGLIPGSEGSLGGGNGNPLQYSCLGNPMDSGAWWAIVHEVARVIHNWAHMHKWYTESGDEQFREKMNSLVSESRKQIDNLRHGLMQGPQGYYRKMILLAETKVVVKSHI